MTPERDPEDPSAPHPGFAAMVPCEQLADVVEALPDAVVVRDGTSRLMFANSLYRALYPEFESSLVEGSTLEENLRSAIGAGLFPQAAGREEAWIAERLQEFYAAGPMREICLPDGRWLRQIDIKTAQGLHVGLRLDITERRAQYAWLEAANEALNASLAARDAAEKRVSNIIDGAGVGTWEWSVDTGENIVNARWAEMLGYDIAELQPLTIDVWHRLMHPDDWERAAATLDRVFGREVPQFDCELRLHHKAGHWVWVHSRGRVVTWAADGSAAMMAGVDLDITDRKSLEKALHAERDLLARLAETSISGIIAFNDGGEIVFANKEAERILALDEARICGRTYDDPRFRVEAIDGGVFLPEEMPYALVKQTGKPVRDIRQAIVWPDGQRRILSSNAAPLGMVGADAQVVCTFTDITAQILAEQALKDAARDAGHMANHDALTGLPNRWRFQELLGLALSASVENHGCTALIFLDLDNFKNINDSLGHDKGDMLLRQVAGRLISVLRQTDTLARLGGDEFIVLLPGSDRQDALQVTHRLLEVMKHPFDLAGQTVFLTSSFGITVAPEDGTAEAELIKNADIAMYRAKATGRNQYAVFNADLREHISRNSRIIQAMQRGLREHRFRLVLQPQFSLDGTMRMIGAEALLRWKDPDLGEISPAEFIPLAEDVGLARTIDLHVVELLSNLLRRCRKAGLRVPVSFNLSAGSFRGKRFAEVLLGEFARLGIAPSEVHVEITETALMAHTETTRENIARLHAAGIYTSLDDFGTGYSSLSALQRLRLNELKIDQSFVSSLFQDIDGSSAIVKAILVMAQALDMNTIAEGVETVAQLDWLRNHGCNAAQGYLLGLPQEIDDFTAAACADKVTRIS
ncbi:EAL domain-containing protein [Paracoccaceae bacterium Fryx2]|nr:EAL domain-containing protein [Paracoccaceae bacterium Fryx2]